MLAFLAAAVVVATMTAEHASAASPAQPATLAARIAEPVPGGLASWDDLFRRQHTMNSAVAAVRAADTAGNYSSAIADPIRASVTIYWRGPVAPAVQAVVDARRKAIPIVVAPAQYTERELAAEAARLGQNPAFASVAPEVDGNGLAITWATGRAAAVARSWAEASSPMPLRYEGTPTDTALLSRQDDAAPYSAGAWTNNCTTGWSVVLGSATRLLTAAHCGANGTVARDGGGQVVGTVGGANTTRDTAVITTAAQARMWDGGVQSTFFKAVAAVEQSLVGNQVCTSGSRSGVRCGIRVSAVNVTSGGKTPLVRGVKTDHTNAAGNGDSGGPVFSTWGAKVIAKGLISGGDTFTNVPCTGTVGGTRVCYYQITWPDAAQTLLFYNASLLVS